MDTTTAAVKKVAAKIGLLSDQGDLKELDSLGVIDLIVELEVVFSVEIPPDTLRPEHFASIDNLARLVDSLG